MIGPTMFGLMDWILDKIAPVGLTSELRTDDSNYWQRPIVDDLTTEYNQNNQMMRRKTSREDRLDG